LKSSYPVAKLHHDKDGVTRQVRARVVCESLTDTVVPVILPKLRFDKWNGSGSPGDMATGHWGWIPRAYLIRGSWDASYNEKHRQLTLTNGSTIQFMSYDQDPEAGEGISLHLVIHDEPPPRAWYKVNQMRTLDTGGQVMTAYTPPTEPDRAVKAAWIFDEVVEPGVRGDPNISVFVLWTEHNRILKPEQVHETVKGFNAVEQRAILYGEETHLSGRIHPLFTDIEQNWCFSCGSAQIPVQGGLCPECKGRLEPYTHVVDDHDIPPAWPTYLVMDPHKRRPCALAWFRVGPNDEMIQQAEAWAEGTVADWVREKETIERDLIGRTPDVILCDPNPLDETDNRAQRGWTLRRELGDHGLWARPADDNFTVGRRRLDDLLRPDKALRRPLASIMRRCKRSIHAFKRYTWDEYVNREGREPKGEPRGEYKHFPDCWRYLVMASPRFHVTRGRWAPRESVGRGAHTGY